MAIIESIADIPLQDPSEEEFCSEDLTWTKFGNTEHHDNVALIPYERVESFIIGECSNVQCPTRFHIERGRKRSMGSLKEYKDDEYLEHRLYWCSFGPENYGEGGGPSRRYRLNTRNRAARPQSMRGCTCHFVIKRLYSRPSLALIIYNERRHVNRSGFVCHGPLDRDAIGPGAKTIPYICNEIQQQTMSMIYLGIPEENILEKHIEGIERYCGSNAKANSLAYQYVHKLGIIIKGYFRRLKYPLFSLLVFDSRQHALPVAWVITRSFAKPDVSKWMKALIGRAHSVDPGWKVSGFLIDDAAAEMDLLSDIFCRPIIFSFWRVRRSWLRNIVKKCSNIEVQREIFKRLGTIAYSIWHGVDASVALEQFLLDFVDQKAFMEYFKASWVPKLEMWLSTMRNLLLASQEASGAIEAYHVKLKAKLFDDSHLGALQRVDWSVHKLTTELHSSYWLDRYADESDSFQNVREEYIASASWHRALKIPDSAVTLDNKDHLFAKVAIFASMSSRRVRTHIGKRSTTLALTPGDDKAKGGIVRKKRRKRRRLSRLR
ncbi:hypothetical protein K1719_014632 [Acacia pycnantha]|nr:hypothetical protein K1719_014632 [Acacia pycnantha]